MSASSGKPTPLYRLYRGVTAAIAPIAWASVARKLRKAGVPAERQKERLGVASLPRPPGQLVWFHAASVGESLSVLTLITRMGERLPATEFLITSGTPTSAELIAKRLPPRTRHQFAPLDVHGPVGRFYNHWRPEAGIFVESEIWPQMLVKGRERGTRLALLNARLSQKSVQGWKKRPKTARFLLDQFRLMLTQNDKTAQNLLDMGADRTRVKPGTNLKATSAPLPVDELALARIRGEIGDRRVWIASSTHAGEEETMLAAHKELLKTDPDLLLLLIPRHPDRGDVVKRLVAQAGLTCAQRSAAQTLAPDTQVYLADTLGETGTWYALCPLVFMGGSLLEIGGHNPFEPAQAGAAVITGPGYFNFRETFEPLIAQGGAVQITDAASLTAAVSRWLTDAQALEQACTAARSCVQDQAAALDTVVETLITALELE
ncbi:3-deoxy-D-manno-octulosonic acid transferase [Tropicibacter sp. Alg240-R139]|uniref:3-deoxy-D-manno-octulosonic acid transferase n=1 Tax=Tropicibacter sp. Alg240-R139 TaxID=2305991 RepID=UPI0013E0D94E|nr:3-deoxy-D-manno-octulosonic acid transferase [Tropicibacter sp. Alg240-R139]